MALEWYKTLAAQYSMRQQRRLALHGLQTEKVKEEQDDEGTEDPPQAEDAESKNVTAAKAANATAPTLTPSTEPASSNVQPPAETVSSENSDSQQQPGGTLATEQESDRVKVKDEAPDAELAAQVDGALSALKECSRNLDVIISEDLLARACEKKGYHLLPDPDEVEKDPALAKDSELERMAEETQNIKATMASTARTTTRNQLLMEALRKEKAELQQQQPPPPQPTPEGSEPGPGPSPTPPEDKGMNEDADSDGGLEEISVSPMDQDDQDLNGIPSDSDSHSSSSPSTNEKRRVMHRPAGKAKAKAKAKASTAKPKAKGKAKAASAKAKGGAKSLPKPRAAKAEAKKAPKAKAAKTKAERMKEHLPCLQAVFAKEGPEARLGGIALVD